MRRQIQRSWGWNGGKEWYDLFLSRLLSVCLRKLVLASINHLTHSFTISISSQSTKLQDNGWKPRWFEQDAEDGTYHYKGGYWEARDQGRWDGCLNIFGEFSETWTTGIAATLTLFIHPNCNATILVVVGAALRPKASSGWGRRGEMNAMQWI